MFRLLNVDELSTLTPFQRPVFHLVKTTGCVHTVCVFACLATRENLAKKVCNPFCCNSSRAFR